MLGLICTALGCLPAQVGSIPWPDAMDLVDYWVDHPPVHQLLAGFMGIKPRKKAPVEQEAQDMTNVPPEMQALMKLFNGA